MRKLTVLVSILSVAVAFGLSTSAQEQAPEKKAAKPPVKAEKPTDAKAAADKPEDDKPKPPWSADTWAGLAMRGIGPAVTSGRIADIAVDPTDKKRWYLAVASGGVWGTDNRLWAVAEHGIILSAWR